MNIKMISFNVNGLRSITKKDFYEDMKKIDVDIICLQETKLQEADLTDDLKNLDGYYSYFSHGVKKGYSGTAVYSKIKPLSVRHGFGIERFDNEGRILELEFENFVLINIYFPNGQKDEDRFKYKFDFYEEFFKHIEKIVASGKNVAVCGDYNIAHTKMDIKNAKANENSHGFKKEERELLDKLEKLGYVDTFRYKNKELIKYSWWSYLRKARLTNAGWRLDYFFVNDAIKENIVEADILNDIYGSDHCPVMLELQNV